MKFHLDSLTLTLKRSEELIAFSEVSYFWGQMGAGKTSIARLVDYCLGADIELTPALQLEFVGATLRLRLEAGEVALERSRDSNQLLARWSKDGDQLQAIVPAREADGEVVPGTGVENLSDLIFWLSDVVPPKVRTSKRRTDTSSARLSLRDLLWYCYLDQDDIDSSFFHLDEDAHPFKRLKSRDVLRYVIGFHDEQVAEIEARLDQLRGERLALSAAIEGLVQALKGAAIETEAGIRIRIAELESTSAALQARIEDARHTAAATFDTHATDELRASAKALAASIKQVEAALDDVRQAIDRDRRHLSEIQTLLIKFRRTGKARAVLADVDFVACPRCTQTLPQRSADLCPVCGQAALQDDQNDVEIAVLERDGAARMKELEDIIGRHEKSLATLEAERKTFLLEKRRIDGELSDASQRYDSAYLSSALSIERERAAVLQQIENLRSLALLPQTVERQRERLAHIVADEQRLRGTLRLARTAAESDAQNLETLKRLFLDCLVRAGVPGITRSDRVELSTTTFFPLVYGELGTEGGKAVASFATLSSGGKKTLFKACFAIAVHRLATSVGARLPELLIIDSPMKNISERENREQFERFYGMVYQLKSSELQSTQFVLIDKEFAPPTGEKVMVQSRHMRPGDAEHSPLIPYYEGK